MTITSKKREAQEFLQSLVEANKQLHKTLWGSIQVLSIENKVQLTNLEVLCDALEKPYFRDDWKGNKTCESNYDIIYFECENIVFYELVDKEGEQDGNESTGH